MKYVIVITPILISIVSLIISIKSYRQNMPKLRIDIINENDAFYGATTCKNDKENTLSNYMAGARMRVKNNSAKSIMISQISLYYRKELYELASNKTDIHKEIQFYYNSCEGVTTDGSYIDYEETGVQPPFIIGDYESKDITSLFLFFPKMHKKKINAKLILDTAIGKKHKKVTLKLYDEDYSSFELKSIEQFNKSI